MTFLAKVFLQDQKNSSETFFISETIENERRQTGGNPEETVDLVTFTREILNRTLQFLHSAPWLKTPRKEDNRHSENHCVKNVRISSFLGPERCSVYLSVQSECGKIRTGKTSNTEIFFAMNCLALL